ncbi:M48 family metallopeptidase [Kitasatospora sp. NPDC004669]|uniref:M48 family metallopeptidase n=1 Tax=Kitasatospora sp. NPDC004669 TaxID=3154555 RepID=UPI0033B043F6
MPTPVPADIPATAPAPVHGSPCPDCGESLTADPRFTAWCPACDWNLVPGAETATAITRRERAATVRADRLFQDLTEGEASATGRLDWLLASAVAGLVHLSTAALFCWGLWLLVTGDTPLRCLGAAVLGLVVLLRPRLGRMPRGESVVDRDRAPALYGLADRVAAEVGAEPVDTILVDECFNASYGLLGFRRRSVLTLGLPLWEALDDQQRIALLGHEFGHRVNGDHRRSLWLHSAITALAAWYGLARPSRLRHPGSPLLIQFGEMIANVLLKVVAWLLYRGVVLLDRLTSRAGHQAEYRADALAARVGGTEAARGMLAALLLGGSARIAVSRARADGRQRPRGHRRTARAQGTRAQESHDTHEAPAADLFWERLRERLVSVPDTERERLRRCSARERAAVDTTHPPTHLRLALMDRCGARPAAVTTTPAEVEAIAAELAPHRARVAAALLES